MIEVANSGCPEASRSTAWAYGEAPDDALNHIVGCAECTQLVEDIERVEAAIAGVRPALVRTPRPRRLPWLIAAVALAAAALLVVWARPVASSATNESINIAFQDDLDDKLDDLDLSLDGLDDPDLL